MEDVGRLAGVSQVTVSRALRDPSKVSAATMKKINAAIEATGFVPNAVAGALASARSGLISALIPSLTNATYTSLMREFSKHLRAESFQVLLSETGFDQHEEELLIAQHLSRRPDGILLTGLTHTTRARQMLLASGVPVVEIWDVSDAPIDVCVGFSHRDAGRDVAQFATDSGYTHAACIIADDERARRRQMSFSERFQKLNGTDVSLAVLDRPTSISGGRIATASILDGADPRPEVIFCSSDVIAQGVLLELHSRNLHIPNDVAVIGFGDQDFSECLEPPLTTVRVDRSRVGRKAAQALLAKLDNAVGQDICEPQKTYDLGYEIIRRSSA